MARDRDGKRGADHCLGRSRGGLTNKIHVVGDAQGLAIRLGLTAGQTHEGQIADTLPDHLGPRTIVLADKVYDADRIRELIQDQGATPNLPPKSNRRWKPCFSKRLYRERNLVERFLSKLKLFRRVATRYDKLAANFLAMVQLASMRLWLRAYECTAQIMTCLKAAIHLASRRIAFHAARSPCRVRRAQRFPFSPPATATGKPSGARCIVDLVPC